MSTELKPELWVDIPGFSRYQVSSLGRVRRLKNKRLLSQQLNDSRGCPKAYYVVNIFDDAGIRRHCRVHRLMAMSFIPNPENKPTVDHINRVKTDNRLENLRWATYNEQLLNRRFNYDGE